MDYMKATLEHAEQVYQIVQDTINAVYPKYYPKEVVDFFCQLHNKDNIKKDIEEQNIGILIDNQTIVGTGCRQEEHITRVYVLPQYQVNGYGSYIMQCLEGEIAKEHDKVFLDASLPASHLYQKREKFKDTPPMGLLGVSVCNDEEQWKYFIVVSSTKTSGEF